MANQEASQSSQSSAASHILIPPSEMEKLSDMLKDTFRGEIVNLVDSVVSSVLRGLNEKIETLEAQNSLLLNRNKALEEQNKVLLSRVEALEYVADQAEQYSRENNLRVAGVIENDNENTDDIINIASDLGCDLHLNEIDRSHRIGKANVNRPRPREIIVKFYIIQSPTETLQTESFFKGSRPSRYFPQ